MLAGTDRGDPWFAALAAGTFAAVAIAGVRARSRGRGVRRVGFAANPSDTAQEDSMPIEAGKIRNVAVVGHRGTGKTSLVEAMLFQAGKTNRLGTVEAGTTVSDWDEDEQRRQMSLAGVARAHCEWQGRKINLIDTPGDSGFQADTIAALRVVEGALVVVSGVMGVEVNTSRVWNRAEELELSRVVFVNMLDRERADFFRVLGALSRSSCRSAASRSSCRSAPSTS